MRMDLQTQLHLQAYLDGELPENEARRIANLLAQDSEAAALLKELRQTRQALTGFEDGVRVPESREFYWSKIQRAIEREQAPEPETTPSVPIWLLLRRLLAPATAIAVLIIAALFIITPGGRIRGTGMETALTDSGAMIYHDYSAGVTLVWLSYPADNEVAENDEMGTIE